LIALWWLTLRAWRHHVPRTYWNVPLRTLHAYVVQGVGTAALMALHATAELRLLYPHDTYMAEHTWGHLHLALYFNAFLVFSWPALLTGMFVFAVRPRVEGERSTA
jgi:uncharacterized membrane protein